MKRLLAIAILAACAACTPAQKAATADVASGLLGAGVKLSPKLKGKVAEALAASKRASQELDKILTVK